jgi:hypothetical protein
LAVAAAAAPSTSKTEGSDAKGPEITVVSQSDVRHVNGTNEWKYIITTLSIFRLYLTFNDT